MKSTGMRRLAVFATLAMLVFLLTPALSSQAAAQDYPDQKSSGPQTGQQTFPSAEDACQTLVAALANNDQVALLRILGPDAKEIISSGDDSQDLQARAQFVQKYRQMHRLVTEPDGSTTLYVGAENWPTPIPLDRKGDSWYFDTPAGKKEILFRRVGKNELGAIQVCHELVDAEREYYSRPHDGDSTQQYAQKLFSDPGKQDGLYWQANASAPASPIGPLLASASHEAFTASPDQQPQPFQGYFFRVLTEQGKKAPGGSRNYIVDGKMTGGFAFLAYPAEYRSSGVMTFIVDQDGTVYQKDLGPKTEDIVKKITRYDPDSSWHQPD